MIQRLVIVSAGAEGEEPRAIRSLPRPFAREELFTGPLADLAPKPGKPLRIPLGAIRFRAGRHGTLELDAEASTSPAAYFEIAAE
jgi:hypothetical protein